MQKYDESDLFQNNPSIFIEEILGESLESYQTKIADEVLNNSRVAIAACHNLGKTWIVARTILWFLTCFPRSKVISTAPTYNQVKNILWSEMNSAYAKAKIPLGGQMNMTDWRISPDWFAIGFTPKNEVTLGEGQGTQSSFQGFHAEGGVLVVFDEATGIPANIWTMAEGLLTQAHVKFLAIGNPTSKNSEFYQCFRDPAWTKLYLSCFDSPNFSANNVNNLEDLKNEINKVQSMPDIEARKYLDSYKIVKPYLLTLKWAVENARKWGVDHPLTVSKILGKFPEAGDNTLLPLGYVEEAQRRNYVPKESDRKTIGVDVARFGTDSTVLTAMHGKKQTHRLEFFKRDTIEVSGEVINLAKEISADVIVIDETGVGSGVVDILNDASRNNVIPNCEIRGVQFGARPSDQDNEEGEKDREKYVNLKAKMFGLLQEDLKKELTLLNENVYLEELPSILYRYDQKGRMLIESKDEYKKRTGRKSPDSADSLALANYGHYDELTIAKFSKDYLIENKNHAGSLNSKRNW